MPNPDPPAQPERGILVGICAGCDATCDGVITGRRVTAETRIEPLGYARVRIVTVLRKRTLFGPRIVGETVLHICPPRRGGGEDPVPALPSDQPPSRSDAAERARRAVAP